MKIALILAVLLGAFTVKNTEAQTPKWSTIEYINSSGPVSPEYQYNYKVVINNDGSSLLSLTDSEGDKSWDFKIPSGKSGMKKLNSAVKKSKLLTVGTDEMKSEKNLIGGKVEKVVITLKQDPSLDQPPTRIESPDNVNDKYKSGITKLFNTIRNFIPKDIKEKAGIN